MSDLLLFAVAITVKSVAKEKPDMVTICNSLMGMCIYNTFKKEIHGANE